MFAAQHSTETTVTFDLDDAIPLLERTPHALRCLLDGIPGGWLDCDEGVDTFSPREVLGHLIHGEKTDWMVRARLIVQHGTRLPFEPFDRFAQRATHAGLPADVLLDELEALRRANLEDLRRLVTEGADLDRRGLHPALGEVTLRQLVAAWVVHDLTHIAQIARVMARRYADDVGPWAEYMGVLQWRK